ncbi:hypothetical protein [Gordonia sp. (in: high G+C Gram-positive bacteria)]|uniref:hypothetical protein n=1 Tax=Gordonia sp. (in: high G+C Gram-positive bacteria) TaxID=84139 RepID=UPI003F95BD6F
MRSPQTVGTELIAARKRVEESQAERAAAKSELIKLGEAHPLSRADFEAAGLTPAEVRKIHDDLAAHQFAWEADENYCVPRPWAGSQHTGVIAVVPSESTAKEGMDRGVYLRAPRLKQRINDAIEYLGTDSAQRLNIVRPVVARFTLGCAGDQSSKLPKKYGRILDGYIKAVTATASWENGYDAIFLGEPIDLDIPLGFANRGGIPGVRHVAITDLQNHGQLKGVPTVA